MFELKTILISNFKLFTRSITQLKKLISFKKININMYMRGDIQQIITIMSQRF